MFFTSISPKLIIQATSREQLVPKNMVLWFEIFWYSNSLIIRDSINRHLRANAVKAFSRGVNKRQTLLSAFARGIDPIAVFVPHK